MGTHPIFESDFDCLTDMAEGSLDKGLILDPQSRLQARIDEQSELICILKKRADSLLLDTKQYQTRIEKIENVNSSLKNQLNTEKTKVRMLESRFDDLAENHAEMIKFKDYHKFSATELRAQNEEVRKENESLFSAELKLRDDEIESWKERNKALFEKIEILTIENETLTAKNTQLEEINLKQSDTIDDLTKKVSKITVDMESHLKEKNVLIKKLQTDAKISKENQEKENKKFIDLSLSRGKELSAKDEIISELKAQLSERQKEIDKIENDWSNAKHRLSKDSTIRRLVSENDQLKREIEENKRSFEAFKEHSKELLDRERTLNKRLRSYSIQPNPE